ncbi:tetratricopeptide repeat protein [Ectothiorhodospira shaposhnikovii]|uniref:tetratricopeptide repeat protein n=1 Tax=Ectothiorhodospira shaposhnikovii TaxID=1054 RepID=UPI001906DA6A|nr:tetratricopeptide repeat protein [Ectothiorhodospira shaposhnikovii]
MSSNRNDPCPCGSGRKYKHCCMLREQVTRDLQLRQAPEVDDRAVMRVAADHLQAGRLDHAAHLCAQILAARPDHAQANHVMGLVSWRAGHLDRAAGFLLKALGQEPRNVNLHANLAGVLADQGLPGDALMAYDTALKLQPDAHELHYGAGNQLLALGKHEAAVEAFERVLSVRPDHGPAHNNLAVALMRLDRLDEAEDHAREADRLVPDSGAPQLTLGSLMALRGRLSQALEAFTTVLVRNPRYGEAHLQMAVILMQLGRHGEAADHYRRFLDMGPDDPARAAEAVVGLHAAPGLDARGWRDVHARWYQLQGRGSTPPARPEVADRDPDRPLKLACLLPDPRTPDARFRVLPLLRALSTFGAVHVYGAAEAPENDGTEALQWHAVAGLDEEALAHRLAEDEVDVVLDVLGHFSVRHGAGLVPALLRRPTPLMLSWGYPGLAIPELYDALLADATLVPEGAEADYAETVVRLPEAGVLWCAPARAIPREGGGNPVFGSLQGPEALSDDCLRLWGRVLESVPEASLRLAHPLWSVDQVAEALRVRLTAAGIDSRRVELRGDASDAALASMDVMLDAPGVSAGYVLAGALLAGVPAVSLVGELQIARLGAACLRAAGCGQWVAVDEVQFVHLAESLARDRQALSDWRTRLPDLVARSRLTDAAKLAESVDECLRRLWQCV